MQPARSVPVFDAFAARRHCAPPPAGWAAAPCPCGPAAGLIKPGADCALIVVDVQTASCPAARCRGQGGRGGAGHQPLAAAFDNVVVTQDWHTRATPRLPAAPGQKPFEHPAQLRPAGAVARPLRAGHRGRRAAQDLKLPTAQVILRKGFHKDVDSYSAFEEADRKTTTGLAGYLKARGIKTVHVTGLATDFCVAWTALDARRWASHLCDRGRLAAPSTSTARWPPPGSRWRPRASSASSPATSSSPEPCKAQALARLPTC
jgi:nicotinamidase/pyrazinamidase